ncbi:bacillithiol biosynthesis cysteine-adding enzyme BshC [Shivajiella indica]|uniref:Putative cysteine ligase BshC n=1 Tax=Shivajiella indica TaxID=872115 RepID=A0ABW5B587_9BACT
MIKSTIEPECTRQFSPLFLDYIKEKPDLKPFYNKFPRLENFEFLIQEKKFDQGIRNVLVSSLEAQYRGMEISEFTSNQIQALKGNKTFTVTTGHQLNLFTGPLYFIYKIVSTINLAEKLKEKYPDFHFIPVYWMATEDHDFEEINYFKLDGKKYQWQTDQIGAVGKFKIDESFKTFFREVSHFVPEFFKEAYLSSENLAEAVRKYVHHLFADKGLLIIDGDDRALKNLFKTVIFEDLFKQTPHELTVKQSRKLEELGYKGQIFPREINLFYMVGNVRERIEKVGTIYKVLNTDISFTEEELKIEVETYPERFSPNVVLRPLYEEIILPNLAYLGGPAEVSYWLQLKSVFDHFKTPFPALLPRNFALVLDAPIQRKISKLGLEDRALFQPFEEWKKEFVLKHASIDFTLESEMLQLSGIFDETGRKAEVLEKSLSQAFEAGKIRATKILEKLGKKIRKAEEKRQEIFIYRREAIQHFLYPGESPQERVENFMRFYLNDHEFIQQLFDQFDPLDFNFIILKTNNE